MGSLLGCLATGLALLAGVTAPEAAGSAPLESLRSPANYPDDVYRFVPLGAFDG